MAKMRTPCEIELAGLDGSNPLGFLAALGTLRAVDEVARLRWTSHLRPVLSVPAIRGDELVERVCTRLRAFKGLLDTYPPPKSKDKGPRGESLIVKVPQDDFTAFAAKWAHHADPARLVAAFGSDGCVDRNDPDLIEPTPLSLANNNGGKVLIRHFRQMIDESIAAEKLPATGRKRKPKGNASTDSDSKPPTLPTLVREALFHGTPRHEPICKTFRWDPAELRQAAYMKKLPESESQSSVPGANLLAVLGLTFFPCMPRASGLQMVGLSEFDGYDHLIWPLWTPALSADLVASLLATPGRSTNRQEERGVVFAPEWCPAVGVFTRLASRRLALGKNVYLSSSRVV